jgi:HSP20 family protein
MNELRLLDPFAGEPFEDAFRNLMRPWRTDLAERTPQIRVDVNESDGGYTVKAEVPGVRKEDIDVRVDGDQVTISAEVKNESEEKKDGRVLRSERRYGYASRTFTLGCAVDAGKADAKYENGILQLKLIKTAPTSAKRLEIR